MHPTDNIIVNSNINFLNLKQFNYIKNKNNKTLELIFSDIQNTTVFKGCSLVPLADDHRSPLDFICNLNLSIIDECNNALIYYNFFKCNFASLSKCSNIDCINNLII